MDDDQDDLLSSMDTSRVFDMVDGMTCCSEEEAISCRFEDFLGAQSFEFSATAPDFGL